MEAIGSSFVTETKTSKADTSRNLFESNSTMFLELYLTQLKNQDPTKPHDTDQMMQQLSQLNTSQQLIDVNSNLETLVAANSSSQASALANFINKDIKYSSDEVYNNGNGWNEISYKLGSSYSKVTIEIRDANGDLVNKVNTDEEGLKGKNLKGNHSIVWDGRNIYGTPVPEGEYTISIYADDGNANFTEVQTLVSGTVTGIDFANGNGEPVLTVGAGDAKRDINLSDVASVTDLNNLLNSNI
jgi:flagellar basal-body rod modification protein FlgD